ncbi:MAG: helix-turn-helix transcriptional regulator [Marinilabiliales bacterium]|nr:helix-turn-helix transcriptional regulator [Marinilabiliales bacterium]
MMKKAQFSSLCWETTFLYSDFLIRDLLNIGPDLSYREFEIIRLIEAGLSSKEIADKLFLSVHTVNTHRSNILEKSGKSQISDLDL